MSRDANVVRRRTVALVGLGVASVWATALGLNHSMRRARGSSMAPTLVDGQQVVVLPARLRRPRVGDVVIANAPSVAGVPTWIKRVAAIGPAVVAAPHPVVPGRTVDVLVDEEQVLLLGDNPAESSDGRQYGATPLGDITHVVVWPDLPRPPGFLTDNR